MTEPFGDYSRYYDLFYQDKDYAAEAAYVVKLLRLYAPEAREVLELGAGTGRHACLLAEQGFRVTGVERSEDMLRSAQARAAALPAVQLVQGDIRTIQLQREFDAAISLFHVFSYLTTNEDLLTALRTAWAHIRPGGILVFDFWYGPAVLTQRPETRVKRVGDSGMAVTRVAEPELRANENAVWVSYDVFIKDLHSGEVREVRERHEMRYFFLPDLRFMLESAGFTWLAAEEWLTGRPPGPDTWGVVVVARRQAT